MKFPYLHSIGAEGFNYTTRAEIYDDQNRTAATLFSNPSNVATILSLHLQ